MPLATFKLGKREFVIISRRRYDQLLRIERDQKDAKLAAKAIAAFKAGTLQTVSLEHLKQRLGM